MARTPAPAITPKLRQRCRLLVFRAARRHDCPPAFVVAHTRCPAADDARKEVMVAMICQLKMRRWQVAMAFNRDLRRVRKSVLGV